MATPHDDLFHRTFHHPRHAAGWLVTVLSGPLANAIDWTTLRAAPEKLHDQILRLHFADLVFVVELFQGRQPVFFLIEHKSYLDHELHDQILRYCVHLAHTIRTSGAMAHVVPILVRHGKPRGVEQPALHLQLEDVAAEVAPILAAVRPRVTFFIDDLTGCSEAELRRPGLTALAQLTLLCLARLPHLDASDALAAFDRWADLLRAADRDDGPPPGRDAVLAIGWYALRVTEIEPSDLHLNMERILQRPEETIMSTAEKLLERGRNEGLAEGSANTILRLMEKRFGPLSRETIQRVRAATAAELDRWTDRILDAKTLADVFASA